MEHIILHVTYTCKPGQAEILVNTIKERGLQDKVRAEDGCMQYDYYISREAADTVLLIEMWRDADACAVHTTLPTIQEIRALGKEHSLNIDVQRFTCKA